MMSRIFTVLRHEPAALWLLVALGIALAVGGVIALIMVRSGVSLKPLVFFGVFFGLIIGPQIAYHVLRAFGKVPDLNASITSPPAAVAENDAALKVNAGRFVNSDAVFGAGFDPTLRTDVRRLFPESNVEAAEMVIFPSGDSAIAARFATPENALAAFRQYASMLTAQMPAPDAQGGYTLRRAGDWARIFLAGRTLFVWTSLNRDGLDARQAASASCWSRNATQDAATASAAQRLAKARRIAFTLLIALVLGSSVWFFKGSSWAATITPAARTRLPLSAGELANRLLQVERLNQPITIRRTGSGELEVTWRVDATWLTQARAQGVRRVHKLTFQLDEAHRTVRVLESSAALNASAGVDGATLSWRSSRGIVFFESYGESVHGLVFDVTSGKFQPAPHFSYRYNSQELKAPFIDAVTAAGWTWKPVQWSAPEWLRWLVE